MRVKTDAKRRDILAAAAAEFGQRGFHETTLAHVARRLGSSKATIYNYFPTKGELFGSMLAAEAIPATAALLDHLKDGAPLEDRLNSFARAFLKQQTGERPIALQRLLIVESAKSPDTVRPLHEATEAQIWPRLVSLFRSEQEAGVLRPGEPLLMARQLAALLQGDLPLALLFGARERVTDAEIERAAANAVDFFLAAYGTR